MCRGIRTQEKKNKILYHTRHRSIETKYPQSSAKKLLIHIANFPMTLNLTQFIIKISSITCAHRLECTHVINVSNSAYSQITFIYLVCALCGTQLFHIYI